MVSGERSAVRGKRLAAVILFLGIGAAQPANAQFDAGIPVGTKAPAVTINDLKGRPLDLGTVLGTKPVLIEFWATWCSLCKALLPQLETIRKTWGDRVELIGVNVTVNDSRARVQRYLDEHRPPFRALYDEKGAGARAYDVPGTSYVVVVDRHGKVSYTGSGDKQDLVAAVAKAFQVP
jgi:thiol-disulfide isomerase/thioredoxin